LWDFATGRFVRKKKEKKRKKKERKKKEKRKKKERKKKEKRREKQSGARRSLVAVEMQEGTKISELGRIAHLLQDRPALLLVINAGTLNEKY
jgi:hypothetical protein